MPLLLIEHAALGPCTTICPSLLVDALGLAAILWAPRLMPPAKVESRNKAPRRAKVKPPEDEQEAPAEEEGEGNSLLGKANPLPGRLWSAWMRHVKKFGAPKYMVLAYLTEALCLRASQAASLRAEDFDWQRHRVWCRAFKGHEGTWKPILPSVAQRLASWRRRGPANPKQTRQAGARGQETILPTFVWPKEGYLFPSERSHSKIPHLSKDVAGHKWAELRKSFVDKYEQRYPELGDGKQIRTHSGRRHSISSMAGHGVPNLIGMAFAQIISETVYKGYVEHDPLDVKRELEKYDKKRPRLTC